MRPANCNAFTTFFTVLCLIMLQFDLYQAATLGTLKSGRLIEVGHLTEVQYKLDKKGSKHDFMASI